MDIKLLNSLKRLCNEIISTSPSVLYENPLLCQQHMKQLALMMEYSRGLIFKNNRLEDLMTKLCYIFAPMARLSESIVCNNSF
jgi:hypothetical protein